jgi:hypothetical protein
VRRILGAVLCLAALLAVGGAQAAQRSPSDAFKLTRKSATSFTWAYTNHRAAGTPPVNGETMQITSGNTAILQSAVFGGVNGTAGAQNALVFFPINVAAGATVMGTGTTSAPLPDGTTFKFFVTTDGFATTANTSSTDVTLASLRLPQPDLESAKGAVENAIAAEDKGDAASGLADLRKASTDVFHAKKHGEINSVEEITLQKPIGQAEAEDQKAVKAETAKDANSVKHWLSKARPYKETALRLIAAQLKS